MDVNPSSQEITNSMTMGRNDCIPHDNDVLCGRGVATNRHKGNQKFRDFVDARTDVYVDSTKRDKMKITKSILECVHTLQPPGRFLEKSPDDGLWYEIDMKKAAEKTSQALRDRAALNRKNLAEALQVLDSNAKEEDNEISLEDSKKRGHRRIQSTPTFMVDASRDAILPSKELFHVDETFEQTLLESDFHMKSMEMRNKSHRRTNSTPNPGFLNDLGAIEPVPISTHRKRNSHHCFVPLPEEDIIRDPRFQKAVFGESIESISELENMKALQTSVDSSVDYPTFNYSGYSETCFKHNMDESIGKQYMKKKIDPSINFADPHFFERIAAHDDQGINCYENPRKTHLPRHRRTQSTPIYSGFPPSKKPRALCELSQSMPLSDQNDHFVSYDCSMNGHEFEGSIENHALAVGFSKHPPSYSSPTGVTDFKPINTYNQNIE